MLSDHEQQVGDDVERVFDDEAEEPARAGRHPSRRPARDARGLDEMAVGGVSIAIMLVFVGVPVVGLAVGGATALGWLLWRFWPLLSSGVRHARLLVRETSGDRPRSKRVGGHAAC